MAANSPATRQLPESWPTAGPANSSLCELCKVLEFNDKEHGGRLETSADGESYVKFPDDRVSLDYQRPDTYPDFPSLSAGAQADCQFCQFLKTSLKKNVERNLRGEKPTNVIHILLRRLEYYFRRAQHDLIVLFDYGLLQKSGGFSMAVLAYPGPLAQYLGIEHCSPFKRLVSEGSLQLLPEVSAILKAWIDNCVQSCNQDTNPASLPTRLLDIGSADGNGWVCLLLTIEANLLSGMNQSWRYAALSHCWGDQERDRPPLKTTSANIDERIERIAFLELPKTYQDAITVCRSLNIRYIWIDSLCIIQDDQTDWEKESPMMAAYYEQAYITIIPTAAHSCNSGFLDRRSAGGRVVELELQSFLDSRVKGSYFFNSMIWNPLFLSYQDIGGSKWNRRGWTLCEALFSKRRIFFGKRAIHWSCGNLYSSEVKGSCPRRQDHIFALIPSASNESTLFNHDFWYNQFSHYGRRDFTIPQDRLPGISALAKVVADFTKDQYFAGLWRSDLQHGLLWSASIFAGPIVHPGQEEPPYIAPSWSWLARARNAFFMGPRDSEKKLAVEILDAGTTTDGVNPFGRILDGFITVQGQVFEPPEDVFKFFNHSIGGVYAHINFDDYCLVECSLDAQMDTKADISSPVLSQELGLQIQGFMLLIVREGLCFELRSSKVRESFADYGGKRKKIMRSAVSGLVLIPSGRRANEYCRIGMFQALDFDAGSKKFFHQSGRITII